MSESKIDKIEITLFEITLENIKENKSGIGITYVPNTVSKHLRFGIKIFDSDVILANIFLQEVEQKLFWQHPKGFLII